jgi:HAD superfamily hydrolase (TIGR01490 family)
VWAWVIENYLAHQWRIDVREILERHRAQGDLAVLVSSGPEPLLRHIGLSLGVEHVLGTNFETRGGRYTGRAIKPICIGEFKAKFAQKYLQDQGYPVDYEKSKTYADSTTDLELLEMVGHPVATYPDDALRKIAQSRGWTIYPK